VSYYRLKNCKFKKKKERKEENEEAALPSWDGALIYFLDI